VLKLLINMVGMNDGLRKAMREERARAEDLSPSPQRRCRISPPDSSGTRDYHYRAAPSVCNNLTGSQLFC
jgi:hypothetical protein